ncbi:MAG TPA: hypothetical protein VE669_02860, partial [Actinomycetota bacterium]|nr:hypothetical protein [Actinomycetota bacterium]
MIVALAALVAATGSIVLTLTEFNALEARLDALDARVRALEPATGHTPEPGSSPTPTVPVSPEPPSGFPTRARLLAREVAMISGGSEMEVEEPGSDLSFDAQTWHYTGSATFPLTFGG